MFERYWAVRAKVCVAIVCGATLLASAGCDPGHVGDPCLPDAEYSATFPPFSLREVYLESRSLECATRLCLVNHFQGRVSCPLGQTTTDGEPACFVPGATERVQTEVPAWDLDRPASRTVYCSCRCDGPDPGARYCECPSGFECRKLAPETDLDLDAELAGSYCIKSETAFQPSELGGPTCADAPNDERCRE